MRLPVKSVGVLTLALTTYALKATIIADTNRDGKLDAADIPGKQIWTDSSGALFLANIGDSNRRCSSTITVKTTNQQLSQCNDASDNVQRNAKYLAPVRTMPVKGLSQSAVGSVVVMGKVAKSKVRLFHKTKGSWVYVGSNYIFSSYDLKTGLDLGIDARDVRMPNSWDGRATLNFTISDKGTHASDTVALRVAPVLTHHPLQLAEQVLASKPVPGDKIQAQFVKALGDAAKEAGIEKPVTQIDTSDPERGFDPWAQDWFEPGYSSIPGPNGPVVIRILIRSVQQNRPSGRSIFQFLRSDTVGAVQDRRNGASTDSTGNLETIPPYTYNGRSFPAGRAIMGSQDGTKPLMIDFLNAQEVQSPVSINTDWLEVGHTDESLQFLPSDSKRGWLLMADDPMAGLAILKKAQKEGHGGERGFSRPRFGYDGGECVSDLSLDAVLALKRFAEVQANSAKEIEGNIGILKKETGITDAEILRVPSLYYFLGIECDSGSKAAASSSDITQNNDKSSNKLLNIIDAIDPANAGGHNAKRDTNRKVPRVFAFYPGTINNVVLSNSHIVAPNPWGPLVNGTDVLAEAVTAVYERASYNVTYMDDWFSHHVGEGEVHCGSNVYRDGTAKWW